MPKQLTCHICNQTFCSSKGFGRWDMSFCSMKCHNVQYAIVKKKEEEAEEKRNKENRNRSFTMSYHDVVSGGAY